MPKFITAPMLDGVLDKIASCIRLSVCSAQPNNYAEIAGLALAQTELTEDDFIKDDYSEDVIVYDAEGVESTITVTGRRIIVSEKPDINITSGGDSAFVVLDDGADFIGTPCNVQTLAQGGKINIPAIVAKQQDPE